MTASQSAIRCPRIAGAALLGLAAGLILSDLPVAFAAASIAAAGLGLYRTS